MSSSPSPRTLFSWFAGTVQKRFSRFLIHRYVGHFLSTQIPLDDLTTDLASGRIAIANVNLKCEYINELLDTKKLPIRLSEGWIRQLDMCVPWAGALRDKSEVSLADVHLTFRVTDERLLEESDLVSSVAESISESMSASVASAFYGESDEQETGSIKALSKIISGILRRLQLSVKGLVVRLEAPSSAGSSTAVEIRVENMHFKDDLERPPKNSNEEEEEEEEEERFEDASEFFSLSEDADICKSVTLSGVSVSTDVFLTSCPSSSSSIPSAPVPIAVLEGLTKIVIKAKNADSSSTSINYVDFTISSCGVSALSCPSQLEIVKRLTKMLLPRKKEEKMLTGKPMNPFDLDAMNQDLYDTQPESYYTTASSPRDFDSAPSQQLFESIHLDDPENYPVRMFGTKTNTTSSKSVNGRDKSVTVAVSLSLDSLRVFMTHGDPLSFENVKDSDAARAAIASLQKQAERFFSKSSLTEHKADAETACPVDHLRLLGAHVSASYNMRIGKNIEKNGNGLFSMPHLEITEFLNGNSTEDGIAIHVPLLTFSDGVEGRQQLEMTASFTEDQTRLAILLPPCASEVDPSIVDRISGLLRPQPFFHLRAERSSKCQSRETEKRKMYITVECPAWTADVRIPRPPSSPSLRRSLYTEILRLHVLYCRVNLRAEPVQPLTVNVTASKAIGSLHASDCSFDPTPFITAEGTPGKPVDLHLTVDETTSSLDGWMPNAMATSGIFERLSQRDGPFSFDGGFAKKTAVHAEDETFIRAGSRDEMAAFARKCMSLSAISVHVAIPTLRTHLPSKAFYERLYQRLAKDLIGWRPAFSFSRAASRPTTVRRQRVHASLSTYYSVRETLGVSRWGVDEDSSFTGPNRELRHLFALEVDAAEAVVVVEDGSCGRRQDARSFQMAASSTSPQLFVVGGFHGNDDETFVHLTARELVLARSPDSAMPSDPRCASFGAHSKKDVVLRSLPIRGEERRDNAVGVALRKQYDQDANAKDITVAIALRNFSADIPVVNCAAEAWPMLLKNFFDIQSDVTGTEPPIRNTFLHVHVENGELLHDHAKIKEGSDVVAKLVLRTVDISSPLAPGMAETRALVVLEDSELWMGKKAATGANNMVHIGEVGMLQLEFLQTEAAIERCPLEISVSNDEIKIGVAEDSLAAIIKICTDIQEWVEMQVLNSVSNVDDDIAPMTLIAEDTDDEQTLRDAIESAMEDVPSAPIITNCKKPKGKETTKSGFVIFELPPKSAEDGYELVDVDDDMPRFSDKPSIRVLDPEGESGEEYSIKSTPDYVSGDDKLRGPERIHLPSGHPVPICRLHVWDISVHLNIYGGSDFETIAGPVKRYSTPEHSRGPRGKGVKVSGGSLRDHSVCVGVVLKKLSLEHLSFSDTASNKNMHILTVQDIVIHDNVAISDISKMLYQHSTSLAPRRTISPVFCAKMVENHERDAKLHVTVLPLRLNIDQDTSMFLEDFVRGLTKRIHGPEARNSYPDSYSLPPNMPTSMRSRSSSFADAVTVSPSSRMRYTSSSSSISSLSSYPYRSSSRALFIPTPRPGNQKADALFIKEFRFSPGCTIHVDYHGKHRYDMEQGAVLGVLRGLGQLNKMEISLTPFDCPKGLRGLEGCLQYAIDTWSSAAVSSSLPGAFTSLTPVTPFAEMWKGIRDAFWYPAVEMKKADGHIVKGLQRGVGSFGSSTAAALIGLTQNVFGGVQAAADAALEECSTRDRKRIAATSNRRRPIDARTGVQLAFDAVVDGVRDTCIDFADSLAADSAEGRSIARTLARNATPTLVRTVSVTSKITYNILGGIKNSLRPDELKDELQKWGEKK